MNDVALWLILGTAGVLALAVACWFASKRAWQTRKPDVAPGTALPSLYDLRDRARRWTR